MATADGVQVILDTLSEAFQGEHETELFEALEDTLGLAVKKGERLRQARSTVARPSTGVFSITPSKPEYLSSHRHHYIGRQQLVIYRCERRASVMLMSFYEISRYTTHSLHVAGKSGKCRVSRIGRRL